MIEYDITNVSPNGEFAALVTLRDPATGRCDKRTVQMHEMDDFVSEVEMGFGADASGTIAKALAEEQQRHAREHAEHPAPQYVPFPTDALPQVLSDFVCAGAAALGCDGSYIALPLLTAVASAIGNTRRIRLKNTWSEPAVLWAGNVGESGTMKSPSQEMATKPVWKRQHRKLREWREAKAAYDAEKKEWKATPKEARGEEPEPPDPCEHPLCSDTTVEALADRLSATSRGVLVSVDELRSWLGSFDKYRSRGGGDVTQWLSMHRAGPVKIDRKTGDSRTIFIPHAAVSVCGGIQPDILRRALTSEYYSCGLAARLLLTMPPRKPKRWTEAEIDDDTRAAIDALFGRLYEMRMEPGPEGDVPKLIDLSPVAKSDWIRFYNEHAAEQAGMDGDLAAAWSKLEAYAARFALIDHCVRCACGDTRERVEQDSIEAGVTIARWFGAEARRVYAVLATTSADQGKQELVDWIEAQGGRTTARDVARHLRRYRGDTDRAAADLDALKDAGLGRWEYPKPGKQGGRPIAVFFLTQRADETETPIPDSASGVLSASARKTKVKTWKRQGDDNRHAVHLRLGERRRRDAGDDPRPAGAQAARA